MVNAPSGLSSLIPRTLAPLLESQLERNKSVLLLGPRQVGKTTLLNSLKADLRMDLSQRSQRLRYERDPSTLARELAKIPPRSLVIIDEIQKVPALMDEVQSLIDSRKINFVLTGSSARKLRRPHKGAVPEVNFLPGRLVSLRLDTLTLGEIPRDLTPSLEKLLEFGTLPGVMLTLKESNKDLDLSSYVETYLEEEVRAEALVRHLPDFARFLELACSESGQITNASTLSQAIGTSAPTIQSYYQILVDCLMAERIEPITASTTRKKLTRSPRYLLFDLGVRRLGAREGRPMSSAQLASTFEQFVALELTHLLRHSPERRGILRFWRDPDSVEVDWVIDLGSTWIPIEVKWTDRPVARDAKNLECFLDEYPTRAKKGFVVCRCERRQSLTDRVEALPWRNISDCLPVTQTL